MQRPDGDERPASKLVHFAGQYGGADSDTGEVDSAIMLITLRNLQRGISNS